MPTGIYKRKPFSKKHIKNMSLSWTQKRKRKCSKLMKNRIISKKTREIFRKNWTGKNNPMFGKHYKMSQDQKDKIGNAQKGFKNHQWRGGKVKRICKICKKEFYVKPSTIKHTGAICCSNKCSGFWKLKHRKLGSTSIEIAIEKELKKQCISYIPQAIVENVALVDFLLPNKIIVQCDGIYWHNKPIVKLRDKKQDKIMISYGYKIFRFTDIEINKSPQDCIRRIYGKFLQI